jgi:uncharacterized protein
MTRTEAIELINQYIKNERMIAHCLASEAVMKALARRLGQDEHKWAMAGLLHDLDVEFTAHDMKTHAMETARILREKGVEEDIVEAIMLHNEDASHGQPRSTTFHHALAAAETITGLITATSLVYPDKSVQSVQPKSIVKRMKEKAFAASVSRENIMECEKLGIPLPEFAELALNAMKEI